MSSCAYNAKNRLFLRNHTAKGVITTMVTKHVDKRRILSTDNLIVGKHFIKASENGKRVYKPNKLGHTTCLHVRYILLAGDIQK